jgi:enoyl-CoA hydratase/carnithine racemase
MAEPAFLYEKREGIAYLTFNRPHVRNAVSPEALCRLADAWQDYAEEDDHIRGRYMSTIQVPASRWTKSSQSASA